MSFFNIFSDKGIINAIPFFTALYLAYYESLVLIPLLLTLSVIIFYLLVNVLASKIIEQKKVYQSKKELEDHVYDELLNKQYGKINGFFSLFHWILIIITAIILYKYKGDFITLLLFWYLIVGFAYNFISLFILQWDRIKKAFSPKLI